MNAGADTGGDTSNPRLEAALAYAKAGYAVFVWRVVQREDGKKVKKPHIKGWETKATTNPDTIRRWFNVWPEANVAIHCGKSKIAVIDVDQHPGKPDGFKALAEIETKHGPIWDTSCAEQKSPGGGKHFIFHLPEGVETEYKFAPGIELITGDRWLGVYPSTVGDRTYEWVTPLLETKLPDLPSWIHTESRRERTKVESPADMMVADFSRNYPDTRQNRQRLKSALLAYKPDKPLDHNQYIPTLAGIHSTGWHDRKRIARKWASGELHKYVEPRFNERDFERDWAQREEVRDNKSNATVAKIFYIAGQYGWQAPRNDDAQKSADDVNLISGDEVVTCPIPWLWRFWIVRSAIQLLAGQAGTGKTTIAITLAAIITRGGKWPDGTEAPQGRVVMWTGEDSISYTVHPRFLLAGGDPSRMHYVTGAGGAPFDPANDMPALMKRLQAFDDIQMIIIDPFVSAVKGDSHKGAEVRRDMAPLMEFAEKTGAAIFGITHFTKASEGRTTIDRVLGSQAFGAVARIVLAAGRKAEEDGTETRVLMRAKSNLGPDAGGFKYRLAQEPDSRHPEETVQRIEWAGAIDGRADEVLAAPTRDDERASRHASAVDWLAAFLKENGPSPVRTIFDVAQVAGHKDRTLERAKAELGVQSVKGPKGWLWALPDRKGADDEL